LLASDYTGSKEVQTMFGASTGRHRPTDVRVLFSILAVVSAVALLASCKASVSVGRPEVSKSDVEAQTAALLAAQVHQPTPKVTCPGGLRAKVGASIDCELTAQGETTSYPVHVVVDSLKNGKAQFTATVGPTPTTGSESSTTAP
jgi:hypothetical protein